MITTLGKKEGGMRRADSDMVGFSETITNLRLEDIDTINGIGGIHQIACHLDRFLISEQLMSKYIFIEAVILPYMGSNHWPVYLEVDLEY